MDRPHIIDTGKVILEDEITNDKIKVTKSYNRRFPGAPEVIVSLTGFETLQAEDGWTGLKIRVREVSREDFNVEFIAKNMSVKNVTVSWIAIF